MNEAADPDGVAGAVFAALSDPTRRAVLRQVAERGPVTATELAARVPVTRQAIAKHLGVLEDAGLVTPTPRRTGEPLHRVGRAVGRRRALAAFHRPGLGRSTGPAGRPRQRLGRPDVRLPPVRRGMMGGP